MIRRFLNTASLCDHFIDFVQTSKNRTFQREILRESKKKERKYFLSSEIVLNCIEFETYSTLPITIDISSTRRP